jgi:hypothetical protein
MMVYRPDTKTRSRTSDRRRRWRHALAGPAVGVVMLLAAAPASALFLTTYGDYIKMSPEEQENIVEAAIYEMIHYFVSTKRDDSKSVCVGRYFSGSFDSRSGGYADLRVGLDEMGEQYEAGTLGTGEESYVERAVLKLIKEECGI